MSPAPPFSRKSNEHKRAQAGNRAFLLMWLSAGALAVCCAVPAGCAAPGEPAPPAPIVPAAVADLLAQQRGDSAELRFTLPVKTAEGDPLKEPPAVEILRTGMQPDGSPDLKHLKVVSTTPGALIAKYVSNRVVRLADPIAPEEIRAHPGEKLGYVVRTRASKKRASANSNVVIVSLYPAAQAIGNVQAKLTEPAIELHWEPATKTSGAEPLPRAPRYEIYRGERNPTATPTSAEREEIKWVSPPTQLGTTDVTEYRDASFAFGKTYTYSIRAVLEWEGHIVESSDSEPVTIVARDIFPPSSPQNVVALVVPGPSGAAEVELSWAINSETDLAGYRVHRSEQEGTPGELITPELLPTPALRDTTVKPGHRYWYTVIAVDGAGNESQPSAATNADVAQPSP